MSVERRKLTGLWLRLAILLCPLLGGLVLGTASASHAPRPACAAAADALVVRTFGAPWTGC